MENVEQGEYRGGRPTRRRPTHAMKVTVAVIVGLALFVPVGSAGAGPAPSTDSTDSPVEGCIALRIEAQAASNRVDAALRRKQLLLGQEAALLVQLNGATSTIAAAELLASRTTGSIKALFLSVASAQSSRRDALILQIGVLIGQIGAIDADIKADLSLIARYRSTCTPDDDRGRVAAERQAAIEKNLARVADSLQEMFNTVANLNR